MKSLFLIFPSGLHNKEGGRELGLNAGKDGFTTGEEDHFGKGESRREQQKGGEERRIPIPRE